MKAKLSALLNKIIIWAFFIAGVFLVVTSMIIRDVDFIEKHPGSFIVELIFFAIVSSLIIVVVFARTRRVNAIDSMTWFIALVAKFAVFHILFQLSGVYSAVFGTQ